MINLPDAHNTIRAQESARTYRSTRAEIRKFEAKVNADIEIIVIIIHLKNLLCFSLRDSERNEKQTAKEYCWAITGVEGRS
jgi:hypothetical protein